MSTLGAILYAAALVAIGAALGWNGHISYLRNRRGGMIR